eukprot:3122348-Ditylum_brightwellii.AAC.1
MVAVAVADNMVDIAVGMVDSSVVAYVQIGCFLTVLIKDRGGKILHCLLDPFCNHIDDFNLVNSILH